MSYKAYYIGFFTFNMPQSFKLCYLHLIYWNNIKHKDKLPRPLLLVYLCVYQPYYIGNHYLVDMFDFLYEPIVG